MKLSNNWRLHKVNFLVSLLHILFLIFEQRLL